MITIDDVYYELRPFGVIKQHVKNLDKLSDKYDDKYQANYINMKDKVRQMSYLRFGVMNSIFGNVKSVFDIGCGFGDFLEVCHDFGMMTYGDDLYNFKSQNIIKVENMYNVKVDVVTFFDSLEHFNSLDFLAHLDTKYILISLPFCHNYSDNWFKNWKHRKPDEHIYHFNAKSLQGFVENLGYKKIYEGNPEDVIRKSKTGDINILTMAFEKINKS